MVELFRQFPAALRARARSVRLGPTGVPALLAHPDWASRRPVAIWMHGRTVHKELDPGRYLRWIRAGIGACAVDLPGHGERLDEDLHSPAHVLDLVEQGVAEVDEVLAALGGGEYGSVFDRSNAALCGMSAGGMMRRLCDPHPFRCAVVEAAAGWLTGLLMPPGGSGGRSGLDMARLEALDPMRHLDGWRPVPLLALHSEADRMVPIASQREFLDALRERYRSAGADPGLVELRTWPQTGAPQEHAGFGRFGNDAKNLQVGFLARHLGATPPTAPI